MRFVTYIIATVTLLLAVALATAGYLKNTPVTEEKLSPESPVPLLSPINMLPPIEQPTSSLPQISQKEEPSQEETSKDVEKSPQNATLIEENTTIPFPPSVTAPKEQALDPSLSTEALNTLARSVLINIVCSSSQSGLSSISGSGIVIDTRGIALTNAHIAQYILLSQHPDMNVDCVVRSGSPARSFARPYIVYFPPAWIMRHASDIRKSNPTGTGEHDYALIGLKNEAGTPIPHPSSVPGITKEAAIVTGTGVLVAGYPAEFAGSSATINNLHISTTATKVTGMLTFTENLVDALSLGGTVLAQSGSSGGGVFDETGSLAGLIVTTTEGKTTNVRDLRAITLAHIERSLRSDLGIGIQEFLASIDHTTQEDLFFTTSGNNLAEKLIAELTK